MTFAMLSLAFFKENPAYRVGEHIMIGIGAGHTIVMGINNIKTTGWIPLVQKGQYILLVPMLLGLLLFTRYTKRYQHMAKPTMALIIAVGAGLGLRGSIMGSFLDHIVATFNFRNINDALIAVGVLGTVSYFFFTQHYTRKLVGPLGYLPRLGRWTMMLAFGASFGNAGMGFLSLMIGRLMFLMRTWLGIIS
jgi:hypothetical protein